MAGVIHESSFVAKNAIVIGNVNLSEDSSVWFGCVLRADEFGTINIGKRSNVQDNVSIHVDGSNFVNIGHEVSIGHNAVVHGCTIEDNVIVGMNSTILNNAVIGSGSIIGAGTVVKENTVIPPGSLVVGVPGKIIRSGDNTLKEKASINAKVYIQLKESYKKNKVKIYSHL